MADDILEEVDTGETEDLSQDFIDEDPDILTDEELRDIARAFNIPFEEYKVLTRNMSKTRRKYAEQDNYDT